MTFWLSEEEKLHSTPKLMQCANRVSEFPICCPIQVFQNLPPDLEICPLLGDRGGPGILKGSQDIYDCFFGWGGAAPHLGLLLLCRCTSPALPPPTGPAGELRWQVCYHCTDQVKGQISLCFGKWVACLSAHRACKCFPVHYFASRLRSAPGPAIPPPPASWLHASCG